MTWKKLRAFALLIPAVLTPACGSRSDEGAEDEAVGETSQELAPAGSNALYVPGSSTTYSTMYPGERRIFSIRMTNNGTTPGTNDWTTASPAYALSSLNPALFGWSYAYVPSTIAVGSGYTFNVIVTAPASSATFSAQMAAVGQGTFGNTVNVPVTVSTGTTPFYRCTLVSGSSTIPTTMTPGENRTITITVQNTGSQTWNASGLSLVARDTPVTLWNNTGTAMSGAVAPGQTKAFSVSITAPTTAGTYAFQREMRDANGIGEFRNSGFCVDTTINVGGTPALNSSVVSTTLPTTMARGEVRTVQVVMRNTGTETWAAGSNYVLYSKNSPVNLWNATAVNLPTTTAPNANATFTFNITAPTTPGSYVHAWQLRKVSGSGAGFFGANVSVPVTVTNTAPPYDATVVSQTIPNPMTVGQSYPFSITMRNTGTQTWTGSTFMLYTANSPGFLWGVAQTTLGASESIAPNATKTFTFNVTAPTTPGTYTSAWRMRLTTVGLFGSTAQTTGLVVTRCGNSVIDSGEQCDDGNLVSGDDCSSTCQFEQVVIDPSANTFDRSIRGTGNAGQLGPVTLGDVTGDGVPELLTSQSAPVPGTGTNKGGAGSIYGYVGPVLNGATTVVSPSNAGFSISGVEANDLWGAYGGGRIVIGNIAGDSINDVIVSSRIAAGSSNSRTGAGEAYVIQGSAALATTGLINLGATTLPASVVAHITGLAGDNLAVLGVGQLTGSAAPDLLIGTPNRSSLAGALYIIPGPISGEIDLASPPTGTIVISGEAGSQLGSAAAIGDLNNDGAPDLLAGCAASTVGGRTNTGSAFVAFGPFASNLDFSLAAGASGGPNAVVRGQFAFDRLGIAVAIGNVTGTATNEALIGAIQAHKASAPNTQFGGVYVFSDVTSGTTYDLSGASTATTVIQGADANDDCGTAIHTGKVTGGTYDDIVFACSAADGPSNGRFQGGEVHVVRGRATFPAAWDMATRSTSLVFNGADQGGALGRVQGNLAVLDLDGDNFADLCGGAVLGLNTSGVKTGRVDCYSSPF